MISQFDLDIEKSHLNIIHQCNALLSKVDKNLVQQWQQSGAHVELIVYQQSPFPFL